MGSVKLLPDSVINQIAAGEVVERPSAVVRELIDNSIDACATEISVHIVDGGHGMVRVVDNGQGMAKEDALMAFERHATSKLNLLSDLETIITKGFRGEALPSIASVARVRLLTRSADSEVGTEVEIHGGKVLGVQSASAPVGTDIEVKNLFFNIPARKKFLKSDKVEELRIKELVQNTSLCHPEISWRLFINERQVLSLPGVTSRELRSKTIFKGNAVPLKTIYDEISIAGILGHPSGASGDARTCVVIVNNRIVTDKLVLRAVKEGFSTTLKDREFPVGFVAITLPGQFVDVNVHPQKAEVRFSFPQKIFLAVKTAVAESIKDFKAPNDGMWAYKREDTILPHEPVFHEAQSFYNQADYSRKQGLLFQSNEAQQSNEWALKYSELNYIGQLFSCYLLCQHDDTFYLVDMHAAHERLNYNRIKDIKDASSRMSQSLLVPLTVDVGEKGVYLLTQLLETLGGFGFDLEQFSDSSFIVRAVPSMLQDSDIASLIIELSQLDEIDPEPAAIQTRLDYVAARIACHASVRSGRNLKREEVTALFEAMDGASFSAACPHGRPCVVRFSIDEVERWFGRDR